MRKSSSFSILVFLLVFAVGGGLALAVYGTAPLTGNLWIWTAAFALALLISRAIRVAYQWEKAVVLRLGKFRMLRGPGLFFIIPIIDTVPYWIDTRVLTATFKAEKTLTKDTVPVDVDAVLFWKVLFPEKAVLNVDDYKSAIGWASRLPCAM